MEFDALYTSDGELRRPAQPIWRIPVTVKVDESDLVWTFAEGGKVGKPDRSILKRFANLADATPKTIRDFALRYGPLALCEHGLYYKHNHPSLHHTDHQLCWPNGLSELSSEVREPLDLWRRYASRVKGVLLAADLLRENQLPRAEMWRLINWPGYYNSSEGEMATLIRREIGEERFNESMRVDGKMLITEVLQNWLATADVRLSFGWGIIGWPSIQLECVGLFPTLGLQLTLAVCRATGGVALCSSCGVLEIEERRKPRFDRPYYCKNLDCQQEKEQRQERAKAGRRQRLSEERPRLLRRKKTRSTVVPAKHL